jgi:hypothetical protein
MSILPQDRGGWLRLVALPFEVYVLTAFWAAALYRHVISDWSYAGLWMVWTFVGYISCFWLLLVLGGIQRSIGARKDAQVTWGIAPATPLLLFLMLPWLAS